MLPIRKNPSWFTKPRPPSIIDDNMPIVKPVIISCLLPHRALHLPRMQPRIMLGAEKAEKKIPFIVSEICRLSSSKLRKVVGSHIQKKQENRAKRMPEKVEIELHLVLISKVVQIYKL